MANQTNKQSPPQSPQSPNPQKNGPASVFGDAAQCIQSCYKSRDENEGAPWSIFLSASNHIPRQKAMIIIPRF
jgi:hypothetical protein